MGIWPESVVGMVLDVNSIFIAICDPENMSHVFGNLQISSSCLVITISGFERDCDAILVI